MTDHKYRRTVDQLTRVASMFWPSELSERAANASVIPKLLETQDQFLTVLSLDLPNLDRVFQAMELTDFPANLFLKHLAVLADVGGERLQRLNSEFEGLFPSGEMQYIRGHELRSYVFKVLPISSTLSNTKLGISGRKLLERRQLDDLMKDVIALLVYGSASVDEVTAEKLSNCEIGDYLAKPAELRQFVKQRYIWVSRITGGARANALGHLAEEYVTEYLLKNCDIPGIDIRHSATVPEIKDSEGRTARFDIVVEKEDKAVGIEVSFQVTTNSTIERKAGQAGNRYEQADKAGYRIAYVVDGAGNLHQRTAAVGAICANSHCTVAFSESEFSLLCEFLREYFGEHKV